MTDLFQDKAEDWDARPLPMMISEGVGKALLNGIELHEDMRVMDFGAGTGLICSHVASHVKRVYAVDISASMLEKLAAKPGLQGKVEPVCQDILERPLSQRFDLIVSAMALHHVEDTERVFRTFAQHLKPGGQIALADLDREDGIILPTSKGSFIMASTARPWRRYSRRVDSKRSRLQRPLRQRRKINAIRSFS